MSTGRMERRPRARGGLLEDHRRRATGKRRLEAPLSVLLLEARGNFQNVRHLFRCEVKESQEVATGEIAPLHYSLLPLPGGCLTQPKSAEMRSAPAIALSIKA